MRCGVKRDGMGKGEERGSEGVREERGEVISEDRARMPTGLQRLVL